MALTCRARLRAIRRIAGQQPSPDRRQAGSYRVGVRDSGLPADGGGGGVRAITATPALGRAVIRLQPDAAMLPPPSPWGPVMPVLANARPGVRLLRRPWVIAGLLAALGVASTLHLHLDERLLHALRQAVGAVASADRGVALADYRAELEARPVASVSGNLSGLAWDADRDQLWAVVNNPETLLALSPEGETLARYPLDGFTDVEAVAYLGDDRLLLVEERSQKLVVVPVPTAEAPLRAEAAVFSLALGLAGNAGLEGADYDAAGDRLFLVKEHSPRQLLEVAGLRRSLTTGATAITLTDRSAWLDDHDMARDLSSVHHDAASDHLLLLSDESRLMMELDAEGRLVSYRSLWGGFAGLADRVPQAEGLTLDDQGRLYLVSEPNLFYRFVRED